MKPMQPIVTSKIEQDTDLIYEVKYDGFRAMIKWTKKEIRIISKNNIDLTKNFPEIIIFCQRIQSKLSSLLPLQFDGELVILNNDYQANFSLIQKRGRLKTKETIEKYAKSRPATFIVFDLLQMNGVLYKTEQLLSRKKQLNVIFQKIEKNVALQLVHPYEDYNEIAQIVWNYKGEGIVAKRKNSKYIAEKKHNAWFKEKNWRTIHTFLTVYDTKNDYFNIGVYQQDAIVQIGKCKHGLTTEVYETLKKLFISKGEKVAHTYHLQPAICAAIHTLDLHANELREPEFVQLMPEESAYACTVERLQLDLAMLPKVEQSNETKTFWPQSGRTKGDLLIYMREIFPYIIPYLQNRALTIFRSPDGVEATGFFQKNLPSYAPKYVDFIKEDSKRIQLCNNLKSLIWLANHSAIEYHIPFQTIYSSVPIEIVFDLDPSEREGFPLAIKAALIIKQLLDECELVSFIKTSGNKGLQIHIPIPDYSLSYEQTAIFTEAIAKTVENSAPTLFTTERFKKNRNGKLYIDYVQHGKNKTIIAPYSPRKTAEATVATPLYWEEVDENLHPTQFSISNVVQRVQTLGCPWLNDYKVASKQKVTEVLKMINGNKL